MRKDPTPCEVQYDESSETHAQNILMTHASKISKERHLVFLRKPVDVQCQLKVNDMENLKR